MRDAIMDLVHVNYTGPAIDDAEMLAKLPPELAALLQETNGFIQYNGGLHVRGACLAPAWHSLRHAWIGDQAFHKLYPDVTPDDVPFAEDCMGDQFLLRDGQVWHLLAETGELESLEWTFPEFMENVEDDPGEHLGLHPLLKFQREGGKLQPGELLAAWPPFCMEESEDGMTLKAIPSAERRRFLAELATKFRDLPDGGQLEIEIPE
jgi:hypothetical protein